GAAPVFVHARAHVEPRWDDVDRRAAVREEDDRLAPLLLRSALEPVEPFVVDREIAVGDAAFVGHEVERDRRRPRAVLRNGGHVGASYSMDGRRPCAPSAYHTPKARLATPSAGATRWNERRTTPRERATPNPAERNVIDSAVHAANSASATRASAWLRIV